MDFNFVLMAEKKRALEHISYDSKKYTAASQKFLNDATLRKQIESYDMNVSR